jgi:phospholipid transport system substrate-binding protein
VVRINVPELRTRVAVLFALLALLLAGSAPAEPDPPADPAAAAKVVEKLHAALLGVMKEAKALGYDGRYERLSPVIHENFDLPFMAEKSVGRHWKSAGEENQRALVATFSRFTIANFAGRFDGFSGQSFRTLGVEPATYGTVLVRTRLDEPGGEGVALDYRLRSVDGGWRIVDIYLNGTVSELALRRSEYSALIQREGFKALLAKLDERINDLKQPVPEPATGAGHS